MTLDEAIWKDEALAYSFGERYKRGGEPVGELKKLEAEHRQRADWLKELKNWREFGRRNAQFINDCLLQNHIDELFSSEIKDDADILRITNETLTLRTTNEFCKSFHNGSFGADIERAIQALEQEPCDDAVSRQALIDKATSWDAHFADSERVISLADIMSLPPVTPKYTDEEIQKMQELEQAQLEKAYELGKAESFEEWLSSFNTESAPQCFNAVQELKKQIEKNYKK